MNPEEIKQKTMTMRSGMVRMLRDREYWTAEDIETLKNEYYAGTSINEIAIMLDRSESAVYQKIEQLGLCIRSAVSSRRRRIVLFPTHLHPPFMKKSRAALFHSP